MSPRHTRRNTEGVSSQPAAYLNGHDGSQDGTRHASQLQALAPRHERVHLEHKLRHHEIAAGHDLFHDTVHARGVCLALGRVRVRVAGHADAKVVAMELPDELDELHSARHSTFCFACAHLVSATHPGISTGTAGAPTSIQGSLPARREDVANAALFCSR